MIDLYYWTTPNGHKITIFLEESATPYRLRPVDIGKGDQFDADFVKISPNNRIPAIVDHDPADGGAAISLFESGAILLYLAEKTGRYGGEGERQKWLVMQWLMWQMGGLGPLAGQAHHFNVYAREKIPYAIDRYTGECSRLYAVLERQLREQEFVAGSYSIADMAIYPWVQRHPRQRQRLEDFPNLQRWYLQIQQRPAVRKAYRLEQQFDTDLQGDAAHEVLFGQDAGVVKD